MNDGTDLLCYDDTKSMMTLRKGFTWLELLVVIAVIGLMIFLGALSLSSARARMRDSQRLSDIQILRTAMSQYWLDHATYPTSAGVDLGAPDTRSDQFTRDGFVARGASTATVYVQVVPTGPNAKEYYHYKGGPNGYSIRFQTESDTPYGKANVYYAHANGVDGTDAEK